MANCPRIEWFLKPDISILTVNPRIGSFSG